MLQDTNISSIKISVAFLYTNNYLTEKEIKENLTYDSIKEIKYLGINLSKE
jgi:hypothetical protein